MNYVFTVVNVQTMTGDMKKVILQFARGGSEARKIPSLTIYVPSAAKVQFGAEFTLWIGEEREEREEEDTEPTEEPVARLAGTGQQLGTNAVTGAPIVDKTTTEVDETGAEVDETTE